MKARGPVLGLALACLVAATAVADTFSFSGDRTEVVLAEGRERTLLEGNARVVSNDITLEAGQIELSGTDFRYAEMRGEVRVTDSVRDLVITAGDLSFDRQTENSRARGAVMVELSIQRPLIPFP